MSLKDINTYGELCEEIERVKQSIQEVRQGMYYEQGDEADLQLYLIDLEKLKLKNERKYKLLQKFGLYECDECGSVHLSIVDNYDIQSKSYIYDVTCMDCGYQTKKKVSNQEIKDSFEVDEHLAWWMYV